MKVINMIRKFFSVKLSPDEIVYLTHVQVRAM